VLNGQAGGVGGLPPPAAARQGRAVGAGATGSLLSPVAQGRGGDRAAGDRSERRVGPPRLAGLYRASRRLCLCRRCCRGRCLQREEEDGGEDDAWRLALGMALAAPS